MVNKTILDIISEKVGISLKQIERTINLLEDGGTIPFISRYRKECTGGLDEVQIQKISTTYSEIIELDKRKRYILNTIDDLNKLTPELSVKIEACWNSVELEDLYLPYKPKRKTRAEVAKSKGLEPLAKIIMSQKTDDIESIAKRFVNKQVDSVDDALQGANDIIAEWISEKAFVRSCVRNYFERNAFLISKVVKGKESEALKYENYFDSSDILRKCSSHRLLAMLRGEREALLKLQIIVDDGEIIDKISKLIIKGNGTVAKFLVKVIKDSYKRLIRPSIETEVMNIAKQKADAVAIETFANNLRQLLFAPPLGKKRILAIDPGFRTGCKVVCLDEQGCLLDDDVIYPTMPKNDYVGASKKVCLLVKRYNIDAIAVGNGTASRETEAFLRTLNFDKEINIYVVNESGASIYSTSEVAREEFHDKDVTVRGAVSIGRRLLDPLAELVKIDPKSIGVGQYQHDVDQNKLKEALTFVVESCVNSVGVNVNTASKELLTYVSGLGPQLAQNIVNYRNLKGAFKSRTELLEVPRYGLKAFQQSSAFLRIPDAPNPLDNSAVHPERYKLVETIAKDYSYSLNELIGNKEKIESIDLTRYVNEDIGIPTLTDIMLELEKPGRDPRERLESVSFDESVRNIDDLKVGMVLNGVVTNITQFGVFVDIGLHENGLVHISEVCDHYITSLSDVVVLNQHIKVRVKSLDLERKRISLSMKNIKL
ncbi:MAG: RNA-binding transcriptional accessory protein [Bacteroidales bacterium]|nr:RNA-binding transcriptional accessory protein [Bacteroidales bacterium]